MTGPRPDPERERRFRAAYDDTYADVLRFAQRRGDPAHADDVVAETFLVAWRRLDDLPHRRDDARAWLFGIARHCLLNDARGAGRREALAVRLAAGPSGSTHEGDDDLVAAALDLAAAWRSLSATHQEVLALAVLEDLPSRQAARVLGISAPAYRLRLLRARRALRGLLDPAPRPAPDALEVR